ncbi:Mucin-13 [Pseudocyphellaria aurata]|nr:Mucin-13 [Pseudocyphellaria aurata]
MRASAAFGFLFVATALGVPLKRDNYYENEVVYVTQYVTATGPAPVQTSTPHHRYTYTWTWAPNPAPETTSTTTPVAVPVPTSTSTPVVKAAPLTTSTPVIKQAVVPTSTPASKPAPSTTPKSTSSGPTSGGIPLIDTINKWRGKYGLDDLKFSNTLTANALKTGTDDGGSEEKHELNPGSNAQVITPGMSVAYGDLDGLSPFELSYVAWLCEVQSDPELNSDKNYCKIVEDKLHMRYSDTGHHDILCSTSYKTIGCAFADNPNEDNNTPYQGLWVCDLSLEQLS